MGWEAGRAFRSHLPPLCARRLPGLWLPFLLQGPWGSPGVISLPGNPPVRALPSGLKGQKEAVLDPGLLAPMLALLSPHSIFRPPCPGPCLLFSRGRGLNEVVYKGTWQVLRLPSLQGLPSHTGDLSLDWTIHSVQTYLFQHSSDWEPRRGLCGIHLP